MAALGADDLLRKLGSGVRPVGGIEPISVAADSPDFQRLLRDARRGAIASGRRVSLPHDRRHELTSDERLELDRAADAAEAIGARTLLAVTDRLALRIDVPGRETTEARSLRRAVGAEREIITGIDAAVLLSRRQDEPGDAPDERPPLAPGLRISPASRFADASLTRLLGPDHQSGE